MLCKKCKTSLADETKKCSYCGVKVSNQKTRAIVSASVLALLMASGFFYTHYSRIAYQQQFTDDQEDQEITLPSTDTTEIEEVILEIIEPDRDETAELVTLLSNALQKAMEYRENIRGRTAFITKNGYLYDLLREEYVKVHNFVESGIMDEQYINRHMLILYLKVSDVANFTGKAVPTDDYLQIYIAYEVEEGFLLVYEQESFVIVSRAEFYNLLALYRYNHGEISSIEHEAITNVVMSQVDYEFYEEYNVVHLLHDSRYAVVYVYRHNYPLSIFVLEKQDYEWSIILYNVEQFENSIIAVNEHIPNLNINLMPYFGMN